MLTLTFLLTGLLFLGSELTPFGSLLSSSTLLGLLLVSSLSLELSDQDPDKQPLVLEISDELFTSFTIT